MNERIQELYKDAAKEWSEANGVFIPDDFVEKFAELIVRECAATMRESVYDNPSDDWEYGYNEGVYSSVDWIQEKFGVE